MASPPDITLFSVRIVSLDYYMAPPIADLGICYSSFHGRTVKEVPVIRIYGSTPAGQKTCLHIHGALPYLYIPCPVELLQSSEEGDEYIKTLITAIEKTLEDRTVSAARQHVHGVALFAKKIYGYHSSEDLFLKIFFLPFGTGSLGPDGIVLGRTFQPYESHIPFLLHFLDDLCEEVGDSAIWLSSTVLSSLIWSDSVVSQSSSESMSTTKRQSICELEADSSIDDILNEKYKIYTSLSQTSSEVKMVQSLIPIWEEFERSGVQEVAKALELSRPNPEDILQNFVCGTQYENLLSEWLTKIQKSLPENAFATEDGDKLEEHIKSFIGIDQNSKSMGCQNSSNSSGEPLNHHEDKNDMLHGLLSKGQGDIFLYEKISKFDELATCKRTASTPSGTEDQKSLCTEALGLLGWLASSQAAEDLDNDDELVHEAILTPLLSTKSIKKALEIAHLDYEHASQQECKDILDSVDYVIKPDVLKKHSCSHEPTTVSSSQNTIHQAHGTSDDSSVTPEKHCHSEMNTSSRKLKSSLNLSEVNTRIKCGRKYRKGNILWGHLPISSAKKEHDDFESASYSCPDDLMENDGEPSISSRSKGDKNCHASNTVADTSGRKLGKPLTSCSVRDLMRQKRHFKVGYAEPERNLVEDLSEAENGTEKYLYSEGSLCCALPMSLHVGSSCVGQENSTCPANCILDLHTSPVVDERIIEHYDNKYISQRDVQNAQQIFHDTNISSHAESNMALDTNMLQRNYYGTEEGDIGSSTSSPSNRILTSHNVEKTSTAYVEMSYSHKPPSKDQIMGILEDSKDATGNVTGITSAHDESLVFDSRSMNSDLLGMNDLLPFFGRDFELKKSYQSSHDMGSHWNFQESALGIPTHFQNDGSVLYLLTHEMSPPSVDSVYQWLLQVEQQRCSNYATGTSTGNLLPISRDTSLKLEKSVKDAYREIDCCPHKIANVYSSNISGAFHHGSLPEDNVALHEKPDKSPLNQENMRNPPVGSYVHTITSVGESKLSSIFLGENVPCSSWQDVSQISGPDDKSNLTPLSQIGFRDPASIGGGQQLTVISLEVLAESRGDLRPDPQFDGINIISLAVQEDTRPTFEVYVLICGVNDEPQRTPSYELKQRIGDPAHSKLFTEISEASIANTGLRVAVVQDEWGRTHSSGIHVGGRIVLNVWRLMRSEVKLNIYSIEAVAEEVLRRKIPSIPYKVALQPAMECLPLVMEPESNFYEDPVVVLDFQSLYPSMIIAYNLCFSTCLGKVVPSKSNVLGVSSYSADPHFFKDLNEQLLLTPNGVMYVPSKIYNARQLALKLIANVTYGYTAAGFSGRMPCAELADSIVQCGRRTLEAAISFVNEHPKWKARVVYGDTDSMFVLLKGRNLEAAFRIGNEIASAVTSMNPDPVTLKLEKVYQPCFLLTKKRYVGYSYESPDQEKPKFDAKGIETVRRDTCPAVAKMLEKSIRLIFEHRDISRVKSYLQRQWTRILSGRMSIQEFIFAKEVHLGSYSTRMSSLPPAAIVAIKAMNADPRAEPRYGERVPYVVVYGKPGARLMDMVVDPHDLLEVNSPYRLNDHYYIKKQIIPALQRVLVLLRADLNQWFLEVPRPVRPILARFYASQFGSSHDFDYNGPGTSRKAQICRHCGGGDYIPGSGVQCNSLACSIFYERRKVQKELQANSIVAAEAGLYPICTAEWF
ncbi:DNA polymerase [Musa troglodytarum]|uniref:DNA polymerase n=1 Tax=Musa troglodytarum TaxID=320322 RepID=A0A9E7EXL2_9LILI|nr:DNA polymerase [Musa troglodytarum]